MDRYPRGAGTCCARRQSRFVILLGLSVSVAALLATLPMTPPASAADLGPEVSAEVRKGTTLKRILSGAATAFRWLRRFALLAPYIDPILEAIEDLLRLLDDAKWAGEAAQKLDALARKLEEIEARLAVERNKTVEIARLQALLRSVREDLKGRHVYEPCGRYLYRKADGSCGDKRDE